MAQILIEEIDETSNDHDEGAQELHMLVAFIAAHTSTNNTDNLHNRYLNTLPETTDLQEDIEVAAKSNALCTILSTVNGQDKVEAILDPKSQVVTMSEEVCNALAIAYDLSVRLSMILANSGIDQTLGLARNATFIIGKFTLYLQVHIFCLPAYNILLGQLFDILTQSMLHNYRYKNQTITIYNLNTGKTATVPTITQGSHRFTECHGRN